jgi:hypothetical protein
MAVDGLVVDAKMGGVCSPAEAGECGEHFFTFVEGYFAEEVKLFVELYQSLVVSHDVEVVLGGRKRCSCDAVFVLGLHIDFSLPVYGENAAICTHAQHGFFLNQPLQQQNATVCELLNGSESGGELERRLFVLQRVER